ncbi:hypothetical protein H4R35_002789 [Dimargaris xerosporica]|nr:hypothetical protein H4R35_002789 [Dimargaris xerosporica]
MTSLAVAILTLPCGVQRLRLLCLVSIIPTFVGAGRPVTDILLVAVNLTAPTTATATLVLDCQPTNHYPTLKLEALFQELVTLDDSTTESSALPTAGVSNVDELAAATLSDPNAESLTPAWSEVDPDVMSQYLQSLLTQPQDPYLTAPLDQGTSTSDPSSVLANLDQPLVPHAITSLNSQPKGTDNSQDALAAYMRQLEREVPEVADLVAAYLAEHPVQPAMQSREFAPATNPSHEPRLTLEEQPSNRFRFSYDDTRGDHDPVQTLLSQVKDEVALEEPATPAPSASRTELLARLAQLGPGTTPANIDSQDETDDSDSSVSSPPPPSLSSSEVSGRTWAIDRTTSIASTQRSPLPRPPGTPPAPPQLKDFLPPSTATSSGPSTVALCCNICSQPATVKCTGCPDDRYCRDCFVLHHRSEALSPNANRDEHQQLPL